MGPSEAIYGDGQLDHLAPARAVVVVQDKRVIFTDVGLPTAQTDAVLKRKGAWQIVFLVTYVVLLMVHNHLCTYVSYFECVPVGVEYIERDFNVLLDALATPFKLPPLQGQIQIIACVT